MPWLTMDDRLEISSIGNAGRVRLSIRGEIDIATGARFLVALEEAQRLNPRRIELDLGDVRYINAAGLRAIVSLGRRARQRGATVAVDNVSSELARVFWLTGADRVVELSMSHDFQDSFRRTPPSSTA